MNRAWMIVLAGAAVGAMTGVAGAQLVTPPPEKVRPLKDVTPTPLPRPVRTTSQQVNEGEVPESVRQKLQDEMEKQKVRKAQPVLPDLQYKSLVQRDGSGNLVPLTEPADLAAMRVNPTLPEGFVAGLAPYLKERRQVIERIVADQLDVLEEVDAGLVEKLNPSDAGKMREVLSRLAPLRQPAAPKPMTEELKEKGSLSDVQAGFNRKIIKEYQTALLPKNVDGKDKATMAAEVVRQAYRQSLDEFTLAYREMKRTAAANLGRVAESEALDATAKGTLKAAAGKYRATMTDAEKEALYGEAVKPLTLDQRREVMRAVGKVVG